jgi:phosphoglycerol transferase MdoB-like AlkP superfamily enzyme
MRETVGKREQILPKKRNNRYRELEARRRKNRRQQKAAAERWEETPRPAAAVAVAEREPPPKESAAERLRGQLRRPRARWRTLPWVRALLTLLFPAVLLYCCQLVTLQEPGAAFAWLGAHAGASLLTYGVLLGAAVLLLAVTGNLLWSAVPVSLPVFLFSFANHMKEMLNGSPVMISDLALAGHAGELAGFLRPGIDVGAGTWGALGILLLLLAVIVLLGLDQKGRSIRWRRRAGGAALGAAAVVLCLGIPPAQALLSGPGNEIQAERNDRLGLLAGFYSGWLDSAVQQPNAYSENNMNAILRAAEKAAAAAPYTAPEVTPNVIMLMSESFCDPEVVLPGVDFRDDPIPNYHALAEKFPSGGFLSNTYAGGTGNVEMEVMTGLPIAFLGSAEDLTALRDRTAYNRMPTIVKTFGWQGYATEFVHSYNDRLYNRAENLPTVGFEKILFEEDFPEDALRAGPYLSDMALTEKLIDEYEHRDKDKPLFLFGLSMENHQPYFGEKFEDSSGLRYTAGTLDGEQKQTLDNILHGLHDADAALGALVDYFEKVDEPTIIVFWGDHLPGLNTGFGGDTLYSILGYVRSDETKNWDSATMKKMHTTRYLVWNNYGADFSAPEEMSTLGMGTHLLDWAGVEKPLYYHWVDEALEEMVLYRQRLFVPTHGEALAEPPANKAVARDYRNLVYDIVYGKGYISGEITKNPHSK